MAVNLSLLNKEDKAQLKRIAKAKKSVKFPKELRLVAGQSADSRVLLEKKRDIFVVQTVLRKFTTLTDELYRQDGLTKARTSNTGRRFLSVKMQKKQAERKLIRLKLTQIDKGRMLTFKYLPKFRDKLEYYDVQPVVIPIDIDKKGFTAINFHHMAPPFRLLVLKQLQASKTRRDLMTHFRISAKIIQNNSRFKFARPMFRRYLFSQLKSPFFLIPESDWNIMQILPSPQFINLPDVVAWKQNSRAALKR